MTGFSPPNDVMKRKARLLDEIRYLEFLITERRKREALLDAVYPGASQWLLDIDAKIRHLRNQLNGG